MPTRLSFRPHRLFRFLAALCPLATWAFALALWPYVTRAQQPAPQKFTLTQIEGLVAHGVPDATLSNQIRLHRLAFAPSAAILDELRAKGAGPQTLAAIETFLPSSPSGTTSQSANPHPEVRQTLGSVPINSLNSGELNLRVLTRVRGNAYQIDSTGDSQAASIRGVGIDNAVILIDLKTGAEVGRCPAYSPYAISKTGRTVAGVMGHELQLCDPLSPSDIRRLQASNADIESLSFSQNSRILAAGYSDGIVRLWDVTNSELLWTSPPYPRPASKVALTSDGKYVAVSYGTSCVRYWRASSDAFLEKQLTNVADGDHVKFLSFVANGRQIVLGLEAATLVWELDSSSAKFFSQGADAISPDEQIAVKVGEYLGASVQGYTPLILWDLSTGNTIATVKTAPGMLVTSATFTLDGTALLASTNSGQVLIWRPPGEEESSEPRITEPRGKGKGPRPTHAIGTVEVHTEPGSLLLLDGNPAGNADAQGRLSLQAVPAGNHELIAKNDGYQEAHLQFALASSEDKPVSLPLTWQGGYLAVSVQPGGAAVTVAGPKTFTVGPAEVKCPPGTYTLTASLDGYSSQTRTIQIVAGEHHNETFALVVDPTVLVRKLDGAKDKLAAGDPAGAEQDADAVLAQTPDNPDAAAIVAESAFQQGDMNRFVDAGAKAILGGKQVTVRMMHAHTVLALWIHPMDVTISESGIAVVSNPPDSRCKIPPSVGFDLIQSAQVVRDPQRGFIELHIQYASKPHGAILHDMDFVPDSSQVVTTRAPGQVFGSGTSSIQEPGNAGQTLNGILRLIMLAKR